MTIKPVEISLFKFFVDILKPYRMYLIGMFFIALYWGVNTTLSPYVLKCIIDKVANFAGDKHAIVHAVMFDVALYIVLWCLNTSNLRLLDWIEFKIFPQLRYDITNKMFAYVGQHAHSYFQKNFTGSVASKIADMNASSVVIISTINEAITQFFGLTIAIMSMLIIHPLFLSSHVPSTEFINFSFSVVLAE